MHRAGVRTAHVAGPPNCPRARILSTFVWTFSTIPLAGSTVVEHGTPAESVTDPILRPTALLAGYSEQRNPRAPPYRSLGVGAPLHRTKGLRLIWLGVFGRVVRCRVAGPPGPDALLHPAQACLTNQRFPDFTTSRRGFGMASF